MTEQVKADIAERLLFLGIGAAEEAHLARIRPQALRVLGPALDRFYGRIHKTPTLNRFFANEQHRIGARNQQEKHWKRILEGDFGADYVESTRAIGNTHARIGLKPQWYVGGYALLIEGMVTELLLQYWPQPRRSFLDRLFRRPAHGTSAEEAAAQIGLLIRCGLLDMELGLETYTQNLDVRERSRAEGERIQSLAALSDALADALDRMAGGDLVQQIDPALEENGSTRMSGAFHRACEGLGRIVHAVRETSGVVEQRAREISSSTEDITCRIAEQVDALAAVARNITELTSSVKGVADEARQADTTVADCCQETEQGRDIVAKTVEAMAKISSSSNRIVQIIGVIDEIAFQTNLLALNAGVEAAHAGDAGRGFAVVAQEIRALAQRSATAAKEIKSLIASSMEDVQRGVQMVDETGTALGNISTSVERLGTAVGQIASGAEAQAQRIMDINASTTQLEGVTKSNAAIVHQTSGASQKLVGDAGELTRVVRNFKVRKGQPRPSQRTSTGVRKMPSPNSPAEKV